MDYTQFPVLDEELAGMIMNDENIPPDNYDKIWITAEEEVIYIKKMEDGHLIAVCILLQKESQLITDMHSFQDSVMGFSQDGMAEESFEEILWEAKERHPLVIKKLNQIIGEMTRRDLRIPRPKEPFPWKKIKAHLMDKVSAEGSDINIYKLQIPDQSKHGIPVGRVNKEAYEKRSNNNTPKQQLY